MMHLGKIVIFCLIGSFFCASTLAQLLGLSEGSPCGNAGGTCRRLRHCPVIGNPRQSRPLLCSFIDREPVVCCPASRAQEMCMLYDRMACNAVDIARRRRDTEQQQDQTTSNQVQDEEGNGSQVQMLLTTEQSEITSTSAPNSTTGKNLVSTMRPTSAIQETTVTSNPMRSSTMSSSTTPINKPPSTTRSTTSIRPSASTTRQTTTRRSSSTTASSAKTTVKTEISEDLLSNMTESYLDSPRMLPPGFSLSSVSDNNNLPEKKIVGGMEAIARELPYMALIGFGTGSAKEWSCGASIVSENFVLSAAHCAKNALLGPARWARVAELDLSRDNSPHLDIPIIGRFIHPGYKEPAVYNDIALFRLGSRLTFSSWVQPICLQVGPDVFANRGVAAGWGRTDFVGDTSQRLLKVDLTLVEGNQCRNLLGRAGRFLPQGVNMDTMICAGEPQGGKDTCTGDSGGPLVVQGTAQCLRTQIGVVSFGRQCAMPNTPGIYTKVSSFIPWIESIVWPQ